MQLKKITWRHKQFEYWLLIFLIFKTSRTFHLSISGQYFVSLILVTHVLENNSEMRIHINSTAQFISYLLKISYIVLNILKCSCSFVTTGHCYQSPKLLRLALVENIRFSEAVTTNYGPLKCYYLDLFLLASRLSNTWLFQANTEDQLNHNPWGRT